MALRSTETPAPMLPRITAVLLAGGIFLVDSFTTLGVAIAVLYSLVVLLSAAFLDRNRVLLVAAICSAFIVISYLIGHGEEFDVDAVIRCVVSLVALWITTILAIKYQRSTQELRSQAELLNLSHDAILVRDSYGVITYWNRGAERLYGWSRDEAVGRHADTLLKTQFPDSAAVMQAHVAEHGGWEGELVRTRQDGSQVVVASRWSLQGDPHSATLATMETANDVTERREALLALDQTRNELAHATRVMTLGELTASIAHEVNQPLAAISANGEACLRWLAREVPDLGAARSSVEKMISNARRASDVIARLRALARRAEPEPEQVPVNEVIEEILPLVEREMSRHQIALHLALDPSEPTVRADRVELQQVALNLVVNAIQALAPVEDRPRELTVSTSNTPDGETVTIEVRDNGPGLGDIDPGKLFAAFFSTKQDGMGMGLSICRSILSAHDGRITAAAVDDGPGARFLVELPAEKMKAAA